MVERCDAELRFLCEVYPSVVSMGIMFEVPSTFNNDNALGAVRIAKDL